jgi:hypothetical protein
LAAGAQADICTLDGPDARLGPVVEFRIPWRKRRLQPFAQLGYFANNLGGESANGERAVVGAGIDILRANGADVRVSIQDAFRRAFWPDTRVGCRPCTVPIRPEPFFRHELSFQVGLIWK